jgi:Tol biopolymer transport system component
VDFDQTSGRVTGQPVNLLPAYQGMNMMGVWTRDGKKLIYASRRGAVSGHGLGRLVVRDIATGEEKEFARPNLNPVISRLAPSPDGRYVVAKVNGLAGQADQMLQLLDTHTGELRTLTRQADDPASGLGNAVWSRDGRAVYYNRSSRQSGAFIVRHDLATGATTRTKTPGARLLALSPAGDSVLQAVRNGNAIHLHIGPVAGGEFRMVAQLSDFGDPLGTLDRSGVAFTPDGKRVVFARATRTDPEQPWGNAELFTVPVSGGEPQSAGLVSREIRSISFAPDGRLTFTAERSWKQEIWSIANIAGRLPR